MNKTIEEISSRGRFSVSKVKQKKTKKENSALCTTSVTHGRKTASQSKKKSHPGHRKRSPNKQPSALKKTKNSKKIHAFSPSSVDPLKKHKDALSLEEQSKYVSLDCEMVGIGPGGRKSALARVCIIDYNAQILLDTFVKVQEPVTDYRTFVSGIRKEDIESDHAMDKNICREKVKSILNGKILIGHALKNDLHVLDMEHPWHDLRDTAKYEPFMKKHLIRVHKGSGSHTAMCPRKLKELATEKLGKIIQKKGMEHSPLEDACTALELYKKVRCKWEKAMEYKIKKTNEIKLLHEKTENQNRNIFPVSKKKLGECSAHPSSLYIPIAVTQ